MSFLCVRGGKHWTKEVSGIEASQIHVNLVKKLVNITFDFIEGLVVAHEGECSRKQFIILLQQSSKRSDTVIIPLYLYLRSTYVNYTQTKDSFALW